MHIYAHICTYMHIYAQIYEYMNGYRTDTHRYQQILTICKDFNILTHIDTYLQDMNDI